MTTLWILGGLVALRVIVTAVAGIPRRRRAARIAGASVRQAEALERLAAAGHRRLDETR